MSLVSFMYNCRQFLVLLQTARCRNAFCNASHESPPDLPTLKRREPFKNAEEWLVADEQLAKSVVPTDLAAASVYEKNKALCDGIYTYFTSKYGTRPNKKHKKRKMRGSGKAQNRKEQTEMR